MALAVGVDGGSTVDDDGGHRRSNAAARDGRHLDGSAAHAIDRDNRMEGRAVGDVGQTGEADDQAGAGGSGDGAGDAVIEGDDVVCEVNVEAGAVDRQVRGVV